MNLDRIDRSQLRQRRLSSKTLLKSNATSNKSEKHIENNKLKRDMVFESIRKHFDTFGKSVYLIVGIAVVFLLSIQYFKYIKTLHENSLWFSKIQVNKNTKIVEISLWTI